MKDKTSLLIGLSWLISLSGLFAVADTMYWGFKLGSMIRYSALIISLEISMVLLIGLLTFDFPPVIQPVIKVVGSFFLQILVSLNILPGPYHYGEI